VKRRLALAASLALAALARPAAQPAEDFSAIPTVINDAIARHELPGAVVLIGMDDVVLYQHAFGQRAIQPSPEPMSEDTIFDLASLTKVVATTTSIMQLVETGRVRLADPVSQFIPEF